MDSFTGRVVYANDDLDKVVDMGNKYSLSGGKDYSVFTNLMRLSHTKVPTLQTFGEEQ
jgi:hypothetical protein